MEKERDALESSSRVEQVGPEGLRQRKGVNPQVIGCPCVCVDALEIRLPKQERPFTKKDIDRFTVTSRLRTLRVLSALVATTLLLDLIHKCMVYSDLYVDSESVLTYLGLQMAAFLLSASAFVSLLYFGRRLTLKHTEYIAMGAYVIALAAYLYQTVGSSITLLEHHNSRVRELKQCIVHDIDNIDAPVVEVWPETRNGTMHFFDSRQVCYDRWFINFYSYSCNLHFHEMMAFAVSCFLPVLMPLNPMFVFVCQNALTWTLVKYWVYWDLLLTNQLQTIMLALVPRVLLSLACAGFAMHQQRYLSIIEGMENCGQSFGYQDIENQSTGQLIEAQHTIMEDSASGALNMAHSMKCNARGNPCSPPRGILARPAAPAAHADEECLPSGLLSDNDLHGGTRAPSNAQDVGNCKSEITTAEQRALTPAWQSAPGSSNDHLLMPQLARNSSVATAQNGQTRIPHINIPKQSCVVRNTFLEVVESPKSSDSWQQDESPKSSWQQDIQSLAWTDERAGIEYKSYSRDDSSRASHSRVESDHMVPVTMSSDSGGSDQLTESSVSSHSDGEHADVLLAEEFVGKGKGKAATKKRTVSLSEIQKVPRHPATGQLTSIGSANHFDGACKPCEWLQRGRCKFGWRCPYCHICDGRSDLYHRGHKRRKQFPAWTDERAGIEYKSYLRLDPSEASHPRDESDHVPITMSSDSGGSAQLTESSVSSHSDSDDADVLLAEEFVGKGKGKGKAATKNRKVSLSEIQKVPRHPVTGQLTSIGSANHFEGACKPCEWLQRGRSCKFGWRCPYCHICDGRSGFYHQDRRRKHRL